MNDDRWNRRIWRSLDSDERAAIREVVGRGAGATPPSPRAVQALEGHGVMARTETGWEFTACGKQLISWMFSTGRFRTERELAFDRMLTGDLLLAAVGLVGFAALIAVSLWLTWIFG